MISVIVKKEPGDNKGPDIQSSLLSSEDAAKERGRQEISQHMTDRENELGSCRYLGMKRSGIMAQITGSRKGLRKGLIKRHNIVIDRDEKNFTCTSHIETEFNLP